jgi:PKD domain
VSQVEMNPRGDIAILLNTASGPALRFRPAGGPLGALTRPFPSGAQGADVDLDARGRAYLVWSRSGVLEARVRRRDGSLTPIQTVQSGALGGRVEVSRAGQAVFAWISSDPARAASVRTRSADGALGAAQTFTVTGEKTRELDLGVASNGDATLVWTTPDAPPNTKVKARTLGFDRQSLSSVRDISTPPSPELSDQPRVAVEPAGNATIVWRHLSLTETLTETRKLSPAGALSGTQILTTPGSRSQVHDVAVDDAGNARAVWVERTSGAADPFLPTTCISGVSSSCGARATLSTTPSLSATVAMGPAGDAMVGWASPSGMAGTVRFLPRVGGARGFGPTHTLSPTAGLPDLALDRGGNGVAVWRQGTVSKGAGFDSMPPVFRRVSIPRRAEPGQRVRASAVAFDVWGARIRWRLGDGTGARGKRIRHTFERAGSYLVKVTATDGTGATVTETRRIRVRGNRGR